MIIIGSDHNFDDGKPRMRKQNWKRFDSLKCHIILTRHFGICTDKRQLQYAVEQTTSAPYHWFELSFSASIEFSAAWLCWVRLFSDFFSFLADHGYQGPMLQLFRSRQGTNLQALLQRCRSVRAKVGEPEASVQPRRSEWHIPGTATVLQHLQLLGSCEEEEHRRRPLHRLHRE